MYTIDAQGIIRKGEAIIKRDITDPAYQAFLHWQTHPLMYLHNMEAKVEAEVKAVEAEAKVVEEAPKTLLETVEAKVESVVEAIKEAL